MTLFSTLKKNAKQSLSGKWGRAILLLVILGGSSLLIAALKQLAVYLLETPDGGAAGWVGAPASLPLAVITLGSSLLYFFLVAPLTLGAAGWYVELVRGGPSSAARVFRYFGSVHLYARALWYHLQMTVRVGFWSLAFYLVPGGLLISSVYYYVSRPELTREASAISTVGITLALLLLVLATFLFILYMNKYALSAYLVCADSQLSVTRAIGISTRYTVGYRVSWFWFQLSFLGWFLLCVLFPPAALYAVPYSRAAFTGYAMYMAEKNRAPGANETQEFVVGEEFD